MKGRLRFLMAALALACLPFFLFANGSGEKTGAPAGKVTLKVAVAGEGRVADKLSGEYIDDCWATNYIKEKWAKPNNIDLQFMFMDDTNDSAMQSYQLMMAAHKAPDLFYVTVGSNAFVANLALSGALADLKPSLDKYGPHIKKFLGEDFITQYGTFYDNLVSIPGQEPIPAISHYWIRQDWLDALGMKMPATFDEWYATMKAFKNRAADLQKAGRIKNAEDEVSYAMYDPKYFTPWERVVSRFYNPKYFNPKSADYYIYSGYGTEYRKDGFKEGFQFVNRMYRDGLISPNFALDAEHTQFKRDIVAGNAGSYCDNLFSGWEPANPDAMQNLLAKNISGAKYEWCHPWTNKYDNQVRNPLDDVVLTYAFVPSYSKAVDAAIGYLDFVVTPQNMVNIQYGVEGTTFHMDPVLGPVKESDETIKAWGHKLGGRELIMIGRLPDRTWSRIQRSNARTAEQAAYAEKIHLGIEANGYSRFPIENSGVQEKAMYQGALRTPWAQFLTALIMSKDDAEFEAAWTKGVKELESMGADKIVEGYKKNVKLLGITK
jgi:putative aldouronate transport system substrate-binding protein